ncbi:hypothetical protein Leryth_026721 [Lithospermum erythrorhizon]|uniref:Transmembrane protein n=1 Tax=Lithospermum erythrorhizon TaxID=34254 RepID=A0AAV3R3C5_LITER|nr:hypothetical protein Leryth_026721 [Lithospermum erythrorhizon]
MNNSMRTGFMVVFAVSGSVVLLALQVHKRLLSDFMKKFECEIELVKGHPKKKVRFSDCVIDNSCNDQSSHQIKNFAKVKTCHSKVDDNEKLDSLPLNWQAMYKGILKCKNLKGQY